LLTVLVQFAATVTGLSATIFRPKVDSTYALACGQTTGSRATFFGGKGVVKRRRKLKDDLDRGRSIADLVGRVYAGDVYIDDTTPLGAPGPRVKTHTTFGYATQVCILDNEGRVANFIAAHDVGRAVNPDLCRGQIEGAIHMGLGYALTEELPCEDGMPVTFSLRELGVLRARDMPAVEVISSRIRSPRGPSAPRAWARSGWFPPRPPSRPPSRRSTACVATPCR